MKTVDQLSLDLIEAQYALKKLKGTATGKSQLILVSGIELAGKGEAVKHLRELIDPRYLRVKADAPQILSENMPFWQPYARYIPREGQIVVLFGNWYSDLLATAMHVSEPFNEEKFDAYVDEMREFEQDLKENQVDVVKFWFDLPWKSLQKRLNHIDADDLHWHRLHGLDWRNHKQYNTIQKLRQRFTQDWEVIDGDDVARDELFAKKILQHLKHLPNHQRHTLHKWQQHSIPDVLTQIPDVQARDDYKKHLKKLTHKVADALRYDTRNVVLVFEGMDAAGKGGSIKRIVKHLDPREYDIHSISAP